MYRRHYFEAHNNQWDNDSHLGDFETVEEARAEIALTQSGRVVSEEDFTIIEVEEWDDEDGWTYQRKREVE